MHVRSMKAPSLSKLFGLFLPLPVLPVGMAGLVRHSIMTQENALPLGHMAATRIQGVVLMNYCRQQLDSKAVRQHSGRFQINNLYKF